MAGGNHPSGRFRFVDLADEAGLLRPCRLGAFRRRQFTQVDLCGVQCRFGGADDAFCLVFLCFCGLNRPFQLLFFTAHAVNGAFRFRLSGIGKPAVQFRKRRLQVALCGL